LEHSVTRILQRKTIHTTAVRASNILPRLLQARVHISMLVPGATPAAAPARLVPVYLYEHCPTPAAFPVVSAHKGVPQRTSIQGSARAPAPCCIHSHPLDSGRPDFLCPMLPRLHPAPVTCRLISVARQAQFKQHLLATALHPQLPFPSPPMDTAALRAAGAQGAAAALPSLRRSAHS
jgi:hypothetical protein